MEKILIAIDGSDYALKAVDYVSKHFSGKDLQIMLFHVLPYVPAEFWDDGHILTEQERKTRKDVVDKWLSNQTLKLQPIFSAASKILTGSGIQKDIISTKWISDSTDVAGSILEEARRGGYDTLVVGRFGHGSNKNRLGTVTEKLVRQGAGITLCIVEVQPTGWTV
jgi:nucleotide-binding universal stress UspA family protein